MSKRLNARQNRLTNETWDRYSVDVEPVQIPQSPIVATVQFNPTLLDVQKNLATGLQLTFEAAGKGARVVVLPELCTSGYALNSPSEAMSCAQERDGYQTEAFSALARRFNCHIVFGYVELREGKLYNSAAIVGPRGLEGNAQKHNLWGPENLWCESSEAMAPVVLTGAGRLGVLDRKSTRLNSSHRT